jgi:hypothetical protein
MEDFTGGVTETFILPADAKTLDVFTIMRKAFERNSLLGCGIEVSWKNPVRRPLNAGARSLATSFGQRGGWSRNRAVFRAAAEPSDAWEAIHKQPMAVSILVIAACCPEAVKDAPFGQCRRS